MKYLIVVALFVLTTIGSFFGGRSVGYQAGQEVNALAGMSLSALDAMGSYVVHANMVQEIATKQDRLALCSAQLYASAKVIEVKACLANPSCKRVIETEVQRVAPELLGAGELKIKFFKVGEKCSP